MQQQRDQTRPSGLMRCPDAAPRVAVKEFVEQHVVAKRRIFLLKPRRAEYRSVSMRVAQKEAAQAPRQLAGDLAEGQVSPGAGRTFNLEVIAVISMEFE